MTEREIPKKKTKGKIDVRIRVPIHSFGSFTFQEFGAPRKKITEAKGTPIYAFPRSTAAIAQV